LTLSVTVHQPPIPHPINNVNVLRNSLFNKLALTFTLLMECSTAKAALYCIVLCGKVSTGKSPEYRLTNVEESAFEIKKMNYA